MRLMVRIPEDVYDDQIRVEVFAQAKVVGFKYRVKLPILDADVPERDERFLIDGYTPDLQEFTPLMLSEDPEEASDAIGILPGGTS